MIIYEELKKIRDITSITDIELFKDALNEYIKDSITQRKTTKINNLYINTLINEIVENKQVEFLHYKILLLIEQLDDIKDYQFENYVSTLLKAGINVDVHNLLKLAYSNYNEIDWIDELSKIFYNCIYNQIKEENINQFEYMFDDINRSLLSDKQAKAIYKIIAYTNLLKDTFTQKEYLRIYRDLVNKELDESDFEYLKEKHLIEIQKENLYLIYFQETLFLIYDNKISNVKEISLISSVTDENLFNYLIVIKNLLDLKQ